VAILTARYNFKARTATEPHRTILRIQARGSGSSMSQRSGGDADLTVAELGEFGLIDRLARVLRPSGRDPLQPEAAGAIGIGDDAALWTPRRGFREVLTTDALIEGVHFRHSTTSWKDLGWKALAENVSDIAAMGARPTRAFITLGLRPDTRVADLEELYRGFDAFTLEGLDSGYSMTIVGGDTVSSPVTMLSITVVGELRGEGLRRAAGRDGDLLAVTGALGGSAGGLTALENGDAPLGNPDVSSLVDTHRRPWPRVLEGRALVDAGVRCGMDLSDGVLGDVGKLAYASGLSAIIDLHCLPMPPSLWRYYGMMALAGGEDYELLVAAPEDVIERASALLDEYRLERPGSGHLVPLTVVGRLVADTPGKVTVLDEHGQPVAPPKGSWDHFRSGGAAS
jgi:thiamine-monophosphate kinase